MRKTLNIMLLFLIVAFVINPKYLLGQCADTSNIYSFEYNAKSYEVIKEKQTWIDAAACAVERGGYLAEINSQAEQDEVYNQLSNKARILLGQTVSADGGNASYVWLGGNDMATEGVWILDGNNDGTGPQFWQGAVSGSTVDSLYSNWGTEPDNWQRRQDALAIALTQWPRSSGYLGKAGQWNDLDQTGLLYYIVEYDSLKSVVSVEDNKLGIIPQEYVLEQNYPNPFNPITTIKFNIPILGKVKNVLGNVALKVYDILGKEVATLVNEQKSAGSYEIQFDATNLSSGIYYYQLRAGSFEKTKKLLLMK